MQTKNEIINQLENSNYGYFIEDEILLLYSSFYGYYLKTIKDGVCTSTDNITKNKAYKLIEKSLI